MKSTRNVAIALVAIIITAAAAGAYALYDRSHDGNDAQPGALVTNCSYIDGLYTNFDLNDSIALFRYVFSRLEDEVTVYPSEGYFYFHFVLRGKTLDGAIMLFTPLVDSGIVDFGYVLRVEDKIKQGRVPEFGGYRRFQKGELLQVTKVDDFTFRLTFEGRSVLFKLYHDEPRPPRKAKLMADEVPVGPAFDESGLRFYLLYNRTTRSLYWILNEDGFVPEDFNRAGAMSVMGQRTGFVFYVDTLNARKILVAVDGWNVIANNWFDGPFDQMPDRLVHVGTIAVKEYLDTAYHLQPDRIDKYGNFRRSNSSRVPVAPYSVYYHDRDLAFVDSCRALGLPPSRFFAAITRQRYEPPPEE